jgi:hypothetical protein
MMNIIWCLVGGHFTPWPRVMTMELLGPLKLIQKQVEETIEIEVCVFMGLHVKTYKTKLFTMM